MNHPMNQQLLILLETNPFGKYSYFVCACVACHRVLLYRKTYRNHFSKCKKFQKLKDAYHHGNLPIKIIYNIVIHHCIKCNIKLRLQERREEYQNKRSCRIQCTGCHPRDLVFVDHNCHICKAIMKTREYDKNRKQCSLVCRKCWFKMPNRPSLKILRRFQ
jgi:hypothetical protein